MNAAMIAPLRDRILTANRIVFFTGAGVSIENGIPTVWGFAGGTVDVF